MYIQAPCVESLTMAKTRLFKNGNSAAVRVSVELAYSSWDIDLVIERQGDELRIRPARRRIGNMLGKLAQFSPDFMSDGRGLNLEGERDVAVKPRYMLETNICIYLMKHQPPQVRARFADCFVGDVVISAITLAELEFGVASSGESRPGIKLRWTT